LGDTSKQFNNSSLDMEACHLLSLDLGYIETNIIYFDPSGVCALSLAAGINEGGHYFRYIFLFFSFLVFLPTLFKTTEGVVVGFQILTKIGVVYID
jgi:hypothetical protein